MIDSSSSIELKITLQELLDNCQSETLTFKVCGSEFQYRLRDSFFISPIAFIEFMLGRRTFVVDVSESERFAFGVSEEMIISLFKRLTSLFDDATSIYVNNEEKNSMKFLSSKLGNPQFSNEIESSGCSPAIISIDFLTLVALLNAELDHSVEFIVLGQKFNCHRAIACLLSPKIIRLSRSNPTQSVFPLEFGSEKLRKWFSEVFTLTAGKTLEINEVNSHIILEIANQLENDILRARSLQASSHASIITIQNVILRLSRSESLCECFDISPLVNFAAEHLYEIPADSICSLNFKTILRIIDSDHLRIYDEDSFMRIILSSIAYFGDQSYQLFERVNFSFLSHDSISEFFKAVPLQDLSIKTCSLIKQRLELDCFQNRKEDSTRWISPRITNATSEMSENLKKNEDIVFDIEAINSSIHTQQKMIDNLSSSISEQQKCLASLEERKLSLQRDIELSRRELSYSENNENAISLSSLDCFHLDGSAFRILSAFFRNGSKLSKREQFSALMFGIGSILGDPDATYNFGCCLSEGYGVERMEDLAMGYIKKAAGLGSTEALSFLSQAK